jgi:hypothetical protein
MTTAAVHHPSHRELVADLLTRLKRVEAAGNTVAALTTAHGTSSAMLADTLRALEGDLAQAARAAEIARERIAG